MLKELFQFITSQLSLFDNPIYNYIAMVIVGYVAFRVAWNSVGFLYDNYIISSRGMGSLLHWFIRTVVFVTIVVFCSGAIWCIRIILGVPVWVWVVLGLSIITILYRYKLMRLIK